MVAEPSATDSAMPVLVYDYIYDVRLVLLSAYYLLQFGHHLLLTLFRLAAVCRPFCYRRTVTTRLCRRLVAAIWTGVALSTAATLVVYFGLVCPVDTDHGRSAQPFAATPTTHCAGFNRILQDFVLIGPVIAIYYVNVLSCALVLTLTWRWTKRRLLVVFYYLPSDDLCTSFRSALQRRGDPCRSGGVIRRQNGSLLLRVGVKLIVANYAVFQFLHQLYFVLYVYESDRIRTADWSSCLTTAYAYMWLGSSASISVSVRICLDAVLPFVVDPKLREAVKSSTCANALTNCFTKKCVSKPRPSIVISSVKSHARSATTRLQRF